MPDDPFHRRRTALKEKMWVAPRVGRAGEALTAIVRAIRRRASLPSRSSG